jgi:hypothetical protein
LTAEATIKRLGLVGTFFITTGWIDQPTYLTTANLQQIAADGNDPTLTITPPCSTSSPPGCHSKRPPVPSRSRPWTRASAAPSSPLFRAPQYLRHPSGDEHDSKPRLGDPGQHDSVRALLPRRQRVVEVLDRKPPPRRRGDLDPGRLDYTCGSASGQVFQAQQESLETSVV